MKNTIYRMVLTGCFAAMVAGCQSPPKQNEQTALQQTPEEASAQEVQDQNELAIAERIKALEKALEIYADGRYDEALAELAPLATAPELSTTHQVRVHKFMAFSYCATARLKQCRQSFELALELDPSFQLTEAERGHPIWGREFRTARTTAKRRVSK